MMTEFKHVHFVGVFILYERGEIMKFNQLPKLIDYRDKLRKHPSKQYTDYGIKSKTHIFIHHSLTKSGSAESYANYHVGTHKWPAIAYHFVIEKDGTIKWCHNLGVKSYHIGNANEYGIGICLTGDFRYQQPTKEQYDSLYKLIAALQDDLNIPTKNVLGHQEAPTKQYLWKQCPALDMDSLRGNIIAKQYNPVKNNFNNDLKIEFVIPDIEEVLDLENYQWKMLEDAMKEFHEKGILSNDEWAKKCANKSLSLSELAFLNTILIKRNLFGKQ